ncbi:ROK family transcriptional regulator [Sphingomonas morindae]|uniref:ROK family protein n=1 Tax=Sphingomonas morindae TaxID=1541170 RepID=A0ABY4X693_9SPHN|nr:ROK family transcriptional regulator [Sphingomonas morindae]USI72428.1 ROK family protein [Sphingomonas morindae]
MLAETEKRHEKLALSLSGTNLVRAGDYNQRTVLQAIRLAGETTRIDLARVTGLTAPTIANITGRLSELGFVRQAGRRQGGRGQPALRLVIEPDGCFGLGINIDRDHISLIALDLAGEVRARVTREIAFATPAMVYACIEEELDGLIAAGKVRRERILGVGIALPDDLGRIDLPHRPAEYAAWSDVDPRELLAPLLPWPIHCDNDAAAAALGEVEASTGFAYPSFFYMLVSFGLGGGLVIDRSYYRGATLRSGEIGLLPDPSANHPGATVQDTVSLSALLARLERAGRALPAEADLAAAAEGSDPVLFEWLHDATRSLVGPLIAINCLINPDAVLIGGRLPMPLITSLSARLNARLGELALPARAPVLPAAMAQDAPAVGAAMLPFRKELLPSDINLIQAGRGAD